MVYGILLESVVQFILQKYDKNALDLVEEYIDFDLSHLNLFDIYEDRLMIGIAEGLAEILQEGGVDTYMQFFGQCFVTFFTNYGYDKILRVAGRHFRDFLLSIDQLHDSTRFSFPKMKSPLFHVTEEDENGAILHYKSKRRGFQQYIVGQLKECASKFFKQEIFVRIQDDLSTNEYSHIVFRVDFNNYMAKSIERRLMQGPNLPDVTSGTFFKVFPFAILLDTNMKIAHLGRSVAEVFPPETPIIGRHLDDVFRLIRPDILLEWNKVLSYGRHIVFVIETRLALRQNPFIVARKLAIGGNAELRLKGQMKLMTAWNMIVFLCHPVLTTTEEMLAVGLSLHDLNFYDGSSEILIAGMQHARTLQVAIEKQHAWITKLQGSKRELQEWRRKGKRLLYSMMPRHIAQMLQEGVLANSICESHKMLTVLFAYSIDFKDVIEKMQPQQIVESINATVNAFDRCAEQFDVFKVETKADSSYMVVAGIQDRSVPMQRRNSTASGSTMFSNTFAEEVEGDMKNPLGLNQTEIIAGLSLEILKSSKKVMSPVTKQPFRVKIGFHSGPAVGGIVGAKNFQYCLFGDTVNTASRITTSGEPGRIHFSNTAFAVLKDSPYFEIQNRGQTELKGRGAVETYWLVGPKSSYTSPVDPDLFGMGEEDSKVFNGHQAAMYDMKASSTPLNKSVDGRTTPSKMQGTNINRRPSGLSGQCPFSGQQLGV